MGLMGSLTQSFLNSRPFIYKRKNVMYFISLNLIFCKSFLEFKNNEIEKNIFIIKPGEDTNRGNGIQLA